jgi:hypothetical protein
MPQGLTLDVQEMNAKLKSIDDKKISDDSIKKFLILLLS